MVPFVQAYFLDEDLLLFERVKRAIGQMEDTNLEMDEDGKQIVLSCHILARAVARVFSCLRVVDGHFIGGYDHSWVETRSGHVIDLYPVAMIGGPIMILGGHASPKETMYVRLPTKRVSDGRFGRKSFQRAVRRVAMAIKATL